MNSANLERISGGGSGLKVIIEASPSDREDLEWAVLATTHTWRKWGQISSFLHSPIAINLTYLVLFSWRQICDCDVPAIWNF